MELEILRLVYDYSSKKKLVDKNYIDKLIDIIVRYKDLNIWVKNIVFTDKLNKDYESVTCAGYDNFKKDILVDYEAINIVMEHQERYDSLFHDLERIMFRNLVITQIILHELEHAYQNKVIFDISDNSIEAKLIRASDTITIILNNPKFIELLAGNKISMQDLAVYIAKDNELYKAYYELNPTERFAEINSYKTLTESLEPMKKYIPNLYEFYEASVIEKLLSGYETSFNEGICPTQVYLYGIRQGKVWTEFDFYDENPKQLIKNVKESYNLSKRLSLGLPVSYEEYETTNNWLLSTNKYML